jgi:hypothetical protein
MSLIEERQTAFCASCGWVGYKTDFAGHPCNPRRVAELLQRVVDLEQRQADLEKQLTGTLLALDIIRSAREGRDVITPGTTQVCDVVPFERPARHAQVTGQPGRTARRALGWGRTAVSSLPQRAPVGGAAS